MPEHSAPTLPDIPAKRYFTIGEVGELCGVRPHVLRYWEQEFTQLRPMKRSGNRRYYQHHEVLLIRRIRALLYDDGFTIQGARNRLMHWGAERALHGEGEPSPQPPQGTTEAPTAEMPAQDAPQPLADASHAAAPPERPVDEQVPSLRLTVEDVRKELLEIREILWTSPKDLY